MALYYFCGLDFLGNMWYSAVIMTNPTKIVVLSDLHNREFCAKDLFRKIGLMDEKGGRADGFHVIQIGDLLSLGYNEQEAEFLKWVRPFIDTQLVGNHDVMAFTPYPDYMEFVGWDQRDLVATQMVRDEFMKARRENDPNMWIAATYVGDWLVTHAGASIAVQKELKMEGWDGTAKDAARLLNEMWIDHIENQTPDPIFTGTGAHNGGIFWHRIEYLRAEYRAQHVNSIVGHSPYATKWAPPAIQNRDKNLIDIDTPGSCCALITEDDGKTWDIVTSDYEVKYGEKRNSGAVYPWENAIKVPRRLI